MFHCVNCESIQRQYDILKEAYDKLNKYMSESKISANPKGAGHKVTVTLNQSHYLIIVMLQELKAIDEKSAVTNKQIGKQMDYKHSTAVIGGRLSDLKGQNPPRVAMIYKKYSNGRTKPHWFLI